MNRREIARSIGLNIATRRVHMGMTQQQLGDRIGVNRVSVSFYENGDRMPDVERLLLLAGVFRCPLVALLGGVPGVLTAAPEGRTLAWRWGRRPSEYDSGQRLCNLCETGIVVNGEVGQVPDLVRCLNCGAVAPASTAPSERAMEVGS